MSRLDELPELSGYAPVIPMDWQIYPMDGGGFVFATAFGPFACTNTEAEAQEFWDAMLLAQAGDRTRLAELMGPDDEVGF